ncbi:hypothetical protein HHL22_23035 [Hymenobacter sp. RP-2-7]|uniref:Uncharacterized protein n=1 Tax=Hymenobacter polaris TaxID=2682546 RepID=A0A7Y0FQ61_9BACT|nr:hypothetical protein [Hymenobacter polaris]NML68084.1 hypothetical protein [Hymenobacter polaris]
MRISILYGQGLALLALAGCRLTSTEVEPALPTGRFNSSSTVVYRANGSPVVANNSADIGTFIVALFGAKLPVTATLAGDSTLTIRAIDSRNQPDGYPQHDLTLQVSKFRGSGTYALQVGRYYSGTMYQEYAATPTGLVAQAPQSPIAGAVNQLTITAWDPAQRTLQGTFELLAVAPSNAQLTTAITAGSLDVDVE